MIFSFLCSFFVSNSSNAATESVSCNIYITASFAPPCKFPFSEATAPVSAPYKSEFVEAMTLAVNVEFGISCSLYNRSDRSRSEEHTSELQSRGHLVCRLLLEKKKKKIQTLARIYRSNN